MVLLTTTCIDSWPACLKYFWAFTEVVGLMRFSQTYWFSTESYIQARGRYVKCILSNCKANYRLVMALPSTSRSTLIIQGYVLLTGQQEMLTFKRVFCSLVQKHIYLWESWDIVDFQGNFVFYWLMGNPLVLLLLEFWSLGQSAEAKCGAV